MSYPFEFVNCCVFRLPSSFSFASSSFALLQLFLLISSALLSLPLLLPLSVLIFVSCFCLLRFLSLHHFFFAFCFLSLKVFHKYYLFRISAPLSAFPLISSSFSPSSSSLTLQITLAAPPLRLYLYPWNLSQILPYKCIFPPPSLLGVVPTDFMTS